MFRKWVWNFVSQTLAVVQSVYIYIFSVYITIYVCDEFIDVLDVIEELNLLTSLEEQ